MDGGQVYLMAIQEGLLLLTAQRAACETCILPIGGSVFLGQNFTEIGSFPAKN